MAFMGKLWRYQSLLAKRAWLDFLAFAKDHAGGSIIALVASLAVLPLASRFPGVNIAQEFWLTIFYGFCGPVVVFIATLLFFRLRAGAQVYFDISERLFRLEGRLKPALEFSIPEDGVLNIDKGTVSETLGGKRYSALTANDYFIAVVCTNIGLETIVNCEAHLIEAWEARDERSWQSLGIVESIPISWDRALSRGLSTTIRSHESKRLYIANPRPNGNLYIFADVKSLPIEYAHIFGEPGIYKVHVVIDAKNMIQHSFFIGINTKPWMPEQNRLPRANATMKIIDQAASPQLLLNTT